MSIASQNTVVKINCHLQVGAIALTSRLDLEPLRRSFDLSAVDDLLKPEAFDALQ